MFSAIWDMTTLATISSNILIEELLRVASQQWSALGVGIRADTPPEAVIDLEALVWCTLEIGRYDPRLFDAVLEWLCENHDGVNLARLRRIAPPEEDPRWRVLASVASVVSRIAGASRWGAFSQAHDEPLLEENTLFWDSSGRPVTISGNADSTFKRFGLIRNPFEPRGIITSPRLHVPASILLKTQLLFGADARAYVFVALLHHYEGALGSEISEQTGYGHAGVSRILDAFVRSGICREERRRTAKWYALVDREGWKKLLSLPFFPPWPNWNRFFQGCITLLRTWTKVERENYSDYLKKSELRKTLIAIQDDLIAGRIIVVAPDIEKLLIDEFWEPALKWIQDLLHRCLFLNSK